MRVGSILVAALLGAAACSGGAEGDDVSGPDTPEIGEISPAFGPLSGGTRIVITGSGFARDGAPPNRVVIGDREAPLAQAVDDETLEVVIPEADAPGAVDVIVFNENGYASLTNGFRYSTPPAVDSVTPNLLRYDQGGTVTLTGSGFSDENAGVLTVLVDGEPAIDVEVQSDTELTFLAPPGRIFTRADIVVENNRGATSAVGYQYGPGPQGGLLLWPQFAGDTYVYFFDPLSLEVQAIPRREGATGGLGFRSVVRNAAGQYLGVDHGDSKLYMIDLVEQTQTELTGITTRTPEIARVGPTFYAIDRNNLFFGSLDINTGVVTQIGSGTLTCCRYAMAADAGGTMYITQGDTTIRTISRTSGALGSPVTLSPSRSITGMRFLGSTLYAVTRQGELITVNPTTGVTDLVANVQIAFRSVETVGTVQ